MTIWQRVSLEKLVQRRLGEREHWGDQVSLMILIRRVRLTGRVGWWRGQPGVGHERDIIWLL